jgi:uncharacterized membrane protein YozB (DUF420 family)
MTLSITLLCYYGECDCAERHILFTIIPNVIMLVAIMLNIIMLCLVMLSVVAPVKERDTQHRRSPEHSAYTWQLLLCFLLL